MQEPISFDVDVEGEVTGRRYAGKFAMRARLPWRDQLRQDRIRRELLGADALVTTHDNGDITTNASLRAQNQAAMVAFLSVHLVPDKCPEWFVKEMAMGLEAEDDAPVTNIYDQVLKLKDADRADTKKRAAEDALKLKAEAAKISADAAK